MRPENTLPWTMRPRVRLFGKALHGPVAGLAAASIASLLVQGYHLGVDDAEIYIPAIKRAADPRLFPFGSEFFMSHAHLSLFPDLVGDSARLTHLPPDLVIFLYHEIGIFLLLMAAWRLASVCFSNGPARWAGVALLAGALSIPVAGTALAIMDPYVTARSLSTPATLMSVACFASNQRKRALAWLGFTALVHPQMSVYAVVFLGCFALMRRRQRVSQPEPVIAAALPFVWSFQPAQGAAREALLSRTYFFLSNWTWYEWFGAFAPLALLGWFSTGVFRGTTAVFRVLARSFVPFGVMFTAAAIGVTYTPSLENYTRLQPMRAFHLIYVIFFVLLGGLAGEYLLRKSFWRWLALFVPIAVGMWAFQAASYPFSRHLEWPGSVGTSDWTAAFFWIRGHTPRDAVFALDPNYMAIPEDDQHGFRAVAERSALADGVKDSGAVALFPQLADQWKAQVLAQSGWQQFELADFERLARRYPVTWVVARRPSPAGLVCPYENRDLAVCRIPEPHEHNR